MPQSPRLSASLFVNSATPLSIFDRDSDFSPGDRVIGLHIADLTIHFGNETDEEVAYTISKLIAQLRTIADAASGRDESARDETRDRSLEAYA